MIRPFVLLSLALAACLDGTRDSAHGDSEADEDTDADTDCTVTVMETTPEDGSTGWYGRDPLEVLFSDVPEDPVILVTDVKGVPAAMVLTWASEGLGAVLGPDPPLAPSSAWTLHAEVCGQATDADFTTSAFGEELAIDRMDLIGRTYVLEFDGMNFTEPFGMGAVLSSFGGIHPLLVGVFAVDAARLSLAAAEGEATSSGGYEQVPGGAFWVFPTGDFDEEPFFLVDAPGITLDYEEVSLPITNFHLEGTFASDGASFGGGKLWGVGDTRAVSEDFNGDPGFLCDVAASLGSPCVDCGDGEPYCLYLLAEDILAPQVPGLVLDPDARSGRLRR